MRTLGTPFDQVNSEQLIKRYYNFVSPIDSASPAETAVTLAAGDARTFSVATPQPATHALSATWLLDDAPIGSGLELTLSGAALPAGAHTLRVIVRDATPAVREDPSGVLQAARSWALTRN
jgi:hypothetical protein